ncbi:MAG: hypothetical protein KBG83_06160 [Bacteroidetes bacterium]|nr:hypothetical protein [Bacteroidota bacterium]
MITQGKKFQVVFTGELEDGSDLAEVKKKLIEVFKTTPERIEKLFAGHPVIINQNLDEVHAQEYIKALSSVGIRCKIEPMPEVFVIPPSKVATPQVQPTQSHHTSKRTYSKSGFFVAAGMLLLLFAYIVVIFFLLRSLFVHIDENFEWIETLPTVLGILAYSGVIIFYGILIFALVKQFFTSTSRKQPSVILAKKKEPAIYSFVEKICTAVSSKTPSLIEAHSGTTIAIEYKQGILSFLEEQQTLSIGLQLLSNLTMEEFACLLADELAYYSNNIQSRIYYFIKSIINLFYRAAFEKDAIDRSIEIKKDTAGNIVTRLFFSLILFINKIAKWINMLFLYIGYSICKSYLFKMEYEADRTASQLVGYNAFESALIKQSITDNIFQEANDELRKERKPNDNSLPNNFIQYTSLLLNNKPDEEMKKLKSRLMNNEEGKSKLKLKPSLQDRIAYVKKKGFKGVFSSDKPATSLISQFPEISKALTSRYYHEQLHLKFSSEDLVPPEQFIHTPSQNNDMIIDSTTENDFF